MPFGPGLQPGEPPLLNRPTVAARRIETDEDVRDVIAMLRLKYDRAVATHGLPEAVGA